MTQEEYNKRKREIEYKYKWNLDDLERQKQSLKEDYSEDDEYLKEALADKDEDIAYNEKWYKEQIEKLEAEYNEQKEESGKKEESLPETEQSSASSNETEQKIESPPVSDNNSDSSNVFSSSQNNASDNIENVVAQSADNAGNTVPYSSELTASNSILNKGVVFPIIRINDHYFLPEEISEFYIESGYYKDYNDYFTYKHPINGFVPTLHLVVTTSASDLLKENQIKTGDKCAVFFSGGGAMVRSYRGDYIITSVTSSTKKTEEPNKNMTFFIKGELFVPNLLNESNRFNFNGSSRDAVFECAKKLGLSFFFCDPDDTDDVQGWLCDKNIKEFILDVTSHAWKNYYAFYDSWIDPRYGLSFININKMLIEDGLDEPLDLTPFVSTINNSVGIDGLKVKKEPEEEKKKPRPQAKMLTNILRDDEAMTPFYVTHWEFINNGGEITNLIGANRSESFNIDNPGLDTANSNIDMNYMVPYNETKMKNGFYIQMGSGINLTYTQAESVDKNMSYINNSQKLLNAGISEVMSNEDAEQLLLTGGNMYSSGNTHRFYDVAWQHNMINNLQLQKRVVSVEALGCNLAVMRGEKIPMLILDYDRANALARSGDYGATVVQNCLYEDVCGWYIIDGIKWEWKKNRMTNGSSLWRTKFKLVRREWPIPGVDNGVIKNSQEIINSIETSSKGTTTESDTTANASGNVGSSTSAGSGTLPGTNSVTNNEDIINNEESNNSIGNISSGYNKTSIERRLNRRNHEDLGEYEGVGTSATSKITASEEDNETDADVPLTGLTDTLKTVYRIIKSNIPGIKLTSARRWAVDENGNRIDGNAFVVKNGQYKCVNANGQIMYFESADSPHLYGLAIDIVNKQGTSFDDVFVNMVTNQEILMTMAMAGVAAAIEQTTMATGELAKHYHIGPEKNIQDPFWDAVEQMNNNLPSVLKNTIYNRRSYNDKILNSMNVKTRVDVEEED